MVARESRLRFSLLGLVVLGLVVVGYSALAGSVAFAGLGLVALVGSTLVLLRGEQYVAPTMIALAAVSAAVVAADAVTAAVSTVTILFGVLAIAAGFQGVQYWRARRTVGGR